VPTIEKYPRICAAAYSIAIEDILDLNSDGVSTGSPAHLARHTRLRDLEREDDNIDGVLGI